MTKYLNSVFAFVFVCPIAFLFWHFSCLSPPLTFCCWWKCFLKPEHETAVFIYTSYCPASLVIFCEQLCKCHVYSSHTILLFVLFLTCKCKCINEFCVISQKALAFVSVYVCYDLFLFYFFSPLLLVLFSKQLIATNLCQIQISHTSSLFNLSVWV